VATEQKGKDWSGLRGGRVRNKLMVTGKPTTKTGEDKGRDRKTGDQRSKRSFDYKRGKDKGKDEDAKKRERSCSSKRGSGAARYKGSPEKIRGININGSRWTEESKEKGRLVKKMVAIVSHKKEGECERNNGTGKPRWEQVREGDAV